MSSTHQSSSNRSAPVLRCTVRTSDDSYVTEGIAVRIERSAGTEVRVTELSEPGALLMAYVGRGVRRFVLAFEDGRVAEAELLGTTWQSSGRRLCRFLLAASGVATPDPVATLPSSG